MSILKKLMKVLGGAGSGNFGHGGRAGERGGSSSEGTTGDAAKWVYQYSWDASHDPNNIPRAVEKELNKYKPDGPVTLYRFERPDHDPEKASGKTVQSWSHNKQMVESIAEMTDGVVREKTFQPDEVFTDFTKFPPKLQQEIEKQGGDSSMQEVLVYLKTPDVKEVAPSSLKIEVHSKDVVHQYVERIQAGEKLTPVFVSKTDSSRVVDGNHRAAAYKKLKMDVPVFKVDRLEALNKMGEGLSPEEYYAMKTNTLQINPFKSEAQRKWMWATDPEMAKEWEKETPDDEDLPKKTIRVNGLAEGVVPMATVVLRVVRPEVKVNGGAGSGNFGHAGVPGQVGGSASGGDSGAEALSKNEKYVAGLKPEDSKVVRRYTGGDFTWMNRHLRTGAKTSDSVKEKIAVLKRVIDEAPPIGEQILSRHLGPGFLTEVAKMKEGEEWTEKGFFSSSLKDPNDKKEGDWRDAVTFRVITSDNTKGISVREMSGHAAEQEAILPPTTFRVVKIEEMPGQVPARNPTDYTITLEVVHQSSSEPKTNSFLQRLLKTLGSGSSGNFGHGGRPGQRGGSAPKGESGGSTKAETKTEPAPHTQIEKVREAWTKTSDAGMISRYAGHIVEQMHAKTAEAKVRYEKANKEYDEVALSPDRRRVQNEYSALRIAHLSIENNWGDVPFVLRQVSERLGRPITSAEEVKSLHDEALVKENDWNRKWNEALEKRSAAVNELARPLVEANDTIREAFVIGKEVKVAEEVWPRSSAAQVRGEQKQAALWLTNIVDPAKINIPITVTRGTTGTSTHQLVTLNDGTKWGVIKLGSGVDGATFVHEYGHHIEDVVGARGESQKLLKEREDNNMGFPVDHYAMRRYDKHDATEVIAVGMEHLYRDPARFKEADPEHFDFVVGILSRVKRTM